MAGAGGIGTDAYTRMINEKLIQLDTRFAIDNQYTPLINDYSGLRGGSRKKDYITPGISGTQYPLNYPESYALSAGVMRRGRPRHPVSIISPVNSVYPSVMDNVVRLPMGRHAGTYTPKKQGGKRSTKGMMSLTHPGELDYTTKKSSMVHHIGGHYVKSLPRPYSEYSGGKLPSLKDIGRSISRGAKKLGSQIVSGAKKVGSEIKSDYEKTSPEFKMVARQVLPIAGSVLGSSLGAAAGTLIGPEGTVIGESLGSIAGNQLGKYATRKIGLGRKKKGSQSKIPVHTLQTVTHSKKRGGARVSSRHELVKQIMHQHGVSLPVASKYIKQHGLY